MRYPRCHSWTKGYRSCCWGNNWTKCNWHWICNSPDKKTINKFTNVNHEIFPELVRSFHKFLKRYLKTIKLWLGLKIYIKNTFVQKLSYWKYLPAWHFIYFSKLPHLQLLCCQCECFLCSFQVQSIAILDQKLILKVSERVKLNFSTFWFGKRILCT